MRQFEEGQCLWGRIRFKDGSMPEYDRPYLIIEATEEIIKVLNVSTIKGKERNLLYADTTVINNYDPPFFKPCYAKLNSLIEVAVSDCEDIPFLCKGKKLDKTELKRIQGLLILRT